jgi:hypothetical protein
MGLVVTARTSPWEFCARHILTERLIKYIIFFQKRFLFDEKSYKNH